MLHYMLARRDEMHVVLCTGDDVVCRLMFRRYASDRGMLNLVATNAASNSEVREDIAEKDAET